MKSNLISTSFLITLGYFIVSWLLFDSHIIDNMPLILLFPSVLLFGAGYSGGSSAMFMVGGIAFMCIWLLVLLLIFIISKIYAAIKK